MKKFIFLLLISVSLLAQSKWENYTYTNNVKVIEKIGDTWWLGTFGGLVKYNNVTGEIKNYNRGNSNILSNNIIDMTADENGNLWIATIYGISKFDGNEFINYSSANSGLLNNNIKLIKYEKNDGVWVVTDSALSFFDGTNWSNYRKDDEGNNLTNITAIFPVSHYGILYGTSESQVKFLHLNGTFSNANYPGNEVTDVIYDIYNNIVVSTKDGYWTNKDAAWTHYDQYNTALPVSHIYKMVIDPNGSGDIYFGLYQHGLAVLHYDGTWNLLPGEDGSELNYLMSFYVGDKIGLGLAQMNDGFIIGEHPSEWEYNFTERLNVSKSFLHCYDVHNIKIVGTTKYIASRGIDVINGNNKLINYYDGTNIYYSSPLMYPKYLEVDIFNRIWCSDGFNPYLAKIDKGNISVLTSDSIMVGSVNKAMQWENLSVSPNDTSGRLWVNVASNNYRGLGWLDNTGWHIFPKDHSTDVSYPWSFEEFVKDDNGTIWFAGMDGIYSYDDNTFTSYWDTAPLKQVSCILKDKSGNLWFGGIPYESYGWQGGLARFDGTNWITYTSSNSELKDDNITSLARDNFGNIYIGTMNGGMTKIDTDFVWTNFNRDNSPLDNNSIMKISVDKENNNVWIINKNAGVFVYNSEGIVSVKDKRNEIPNNFRLFQNYPNPFNPTTTIKYSIPKVTSGFSLGKIGLKIYDVLGNEIATLVNEAKKPGVYEVQFDATGLSSGVYFYKLTVNNSIKVKRMILLK